MQLSELLCDDALAEIHRNGRYVTLRLTSSMYHRFHAPHDCRVEHVSYIPGDTWNVNPAALRRVDKLYCKNERAVLSTRLTATGDAISLVPVGAILVAGIRLHFVDVERCLKSGGRKSAAPRSSAKATKWAGSSTARPSCYSRHSASRCATTSRTAQKSASASR